MTIDTHVPGRARHERRFERDEDLGAALASLAPDAWRQLFDEQYDAAYHYAQLRTASDIAAGEIARAVFTQAALMAPRFGAAGVSSTGLLFDLTDALIVPEKKRSAASRRNGLSPDGLRQAVGRLSGNERNLVLLRLVEGQSTEATARLLRTSPAKVRSRQMRALRQLSREHGGYTHDGASGLDATLDGCIDRLASGDALEEVLSAQHGRTLELLPMLRVAYGVVRLPRDPAPDDRRENALAAMLREVEAARFQRARQLRKPARGRFAPTPQPVPAAHSPRLHVPAVHLLQSSRARSAVRRSRGVLAGLAAVAVAGGATAALVMTGAVGRDSLGASRLPSSVLVKGNPIAEDGATLWIIRGSELQRVQTTPDTIVFRGDSRATLDGLRQGVTLEIIGTEGLDGTLNAAIVRIRDEPPPANASAP